MRKDLHNNIDVRRAISPKRETTNAASASQIIDRKGYESLEFVIVAGTLATAAATFTPSLEHGDESNLSDTASPAATELLGTLAEATFDGADDDTVYKIGYRGTKRYVRLTITSASNTGNADFAAVAILSNPQKAPVA